MQRQKDNKPNHTDRWKCENMWIKRKKPKTCILNLIWRWGGPKWEHPLPCRLQKWKRGSLWTCLSPPSLSLSPSLTASLCCIARLALCYHGNKDLCDMVRTMEGEKARNSRKGRVYLQSKTCSRNSEGIEEGRRRRDKSSTNLRSHTNICPTARLLFPVPLSPFSSALSRFSQLSRSAPPTISSSFVPFSPILLSILSFLLFYCTLGNKLAMTVVWVKENCNYKNVTPGYS